MVKHNFMALFRIGRSDKEDKKEGVFGGLSGYIRTKQGMSLSPTVPLKCSLSQK